MTWKLVRNQVAHGTCHGQRILYLAPVKSPTLSQRERSVLCAVHRCQIELCTPISNPVDVECSLLQDQVQLYSWCARGMHFARFAFGVWDGQFSGKRATNRHFACFHTSPDAADLELGLQY